MGAPETTRVCDGPPEEQVLNMSFYDKVRRQKFLSFTLILFTLSIGIVIGTLVQTGAKAAKEQAAAPDATPLVVPAPVATESEFTKIAKMLEPSVVNISSEYIPSRPLSAAQGQSAPASAAAGR